MKSRFTQFAILTIVALHAWSISSGTITAQEKVKLPGQYKRVHQQAFRDILGGNTSKAVAALDKLLERLPKDEESHYMLAVAYCASGDLDQAAKHAQQAIEFGLPPGRIVGGTLTGLKPLLETQYGRELIEANVHHPVHGPMVGCVTGESAKIWFRTLGPASVSVEYRLANDPDERQQKTKPQITKLADDFTVEVPLSGLAPNSVYTYRIHIDKQADNPWHTFRTSAALHQPTKFRLAFGGGAGYVPPNERVWDTIAAEKPDMLVLLGDNVYSDDPTRPAMQHYCYYRRQSRPEFSRLIASTPVYSIWDDHDFGTNDCSGGPEIDSPDWKRPVWHVFKNNWVNPYYGGGEEQPGCWYDFYRGDVHFVMVDGRYYRNLKKEDNGRSSMLGPVQRKWLLKTLKNSQGKLIVLCSPVPWVFEAKGDSKDTWNGFKEERNEIFEFLADNKIEGVVLMSADRHRSDLWKIDRENGYALYEFNSSRLTNQHVHGEMRQAVFSYNKKQSFGTVDIDTTVDDPTITYRVVNIDGEEIHKHTVRGSELKH